MLIGVVTPSERAKEMEYITSIGEIEAEADRLEIEGKQARRYILTATEEEVSYI